MTHVLIVEDHEENRNLLKMLLAANGYRVTAAGDGVDALAAARRDRPGLGIEKALAEIERGRGTAYDADAADACLRLFREKAYQLPA